jgi:hypothetical protein
MRIETPATDRHATESRRVIARQTTTIESNPRASTPGDAAPAAPVQASRRARDRTVRIGLFTAWLAARGGSLVGPVAFGGGALLIASEFTDRLETLEGGYTILAFNLILASLLATLIVCAAAIVGDSVLHRAELRLGRRPGAALLAPLLTIAGATSAAAIIIAHLGHALALDAWLGLAGSALLLLAAAIRHRITSARHAPPRSP